MASALFGAAGEISLYASISSTKNGATVAGSSTQNADMIGDQMIGNVQIVGTSNEAINLGDVSTLGHLYCKNMDATNYVEIFTDNANAQPVAKLLAGQAMLIASHPSATYYARANTAVCNLHVVAVEL